MSVKYVIDKEMGTKWFTYFSKVRPWIGCAISVSSIITAIGEITSMISKIASIPHLTLNFKAGLLIGLWGLYALSIIGTAITDAALGVMTYIKSKGDYAKFADFVNKVLVYEVCSAVIVNFISNCIVQSFIAAILIAALGGVVGYYLWYRLNSNYFYNRIKAVEEESTPTKHVRTNTAPLNDTLKASQTWNCGFCGSENSVNYGQCKKCGRFRGDAENRAEDLHPGTNDFVN